MIAIPLLQAASLVLLAAAQAPPAAEPIQAMAVANDLQITRAISSSPNGPPPGMVKIPTGEVVLGTPVEMVAQLGQNDQTTMTLISAETPRHVMTVEAFSIDRTEVTNLQWRIFLDATGRQPSEALRNFAWPDGAIPEGREHHPVTNVNYPEIREYLVWCGKRLPTEAEWIRAARGDTDQAYPWGNRFKADACQSGMTVPQEPVAAGTYPTGASPFGVLDLSGNVFEWTDSPFIAFDGFRPIDYNRGRKSIKLSPEFNSTWKVIKGGSFISTRELSRIDFRTAANPSDSDASLGFRCAKSLQPGLESVRHAQRLLQSPLLAVGGIDETDIFGVERTNYDPKRGIVTSYSHLAFAYRGRDRYAGYSKLKKDAVDEPFGVGILTTSEALQSPKLPPGEYAVAYKGKGESEAYKEWRKANRDKRGDDDSGLSTRAEGDAMAPWPGPPGWSIHDVVDDLMDFPQDQEVFLFLNANNTIVGWAPVMDAGEKDVEPLEFAEPDDGRTWKLDFSIDNTRRKGPRFTMQIVLATDGLRK